MAGGLYQDQSTAFFNGGLFSSYRGDKYDMHFIFNNDNLKMAENGGITDDRYITNPLDMAEGKKEYSANEIPTRLSQIWNHNTSYHAFLTHRYNLGFYKEKTGQCGYGLRKNNAGICSCHKLHTYITSGLEQSQIHLIR